ncbi:MAG: DUF748 domain-containing protein [Candidatus Omnitrophica bacterium]|jgi:hypothetical protein|nr:DUF748 domain-containing protein [Candidatus Omnitrophota bacterium]
MFKKIKLALIFLLAVILALTFCFFYLDRVYLPTKIKSAIIEASQNVTGKKVSLSSLKLNIFRGIVLTDFKIFDDSRTYIYLPKTYISFFIFPIQKRIVISSVHLLNPQIWVSRDKFGGIDILSLFTNASANKFSSSALNFVVRKMVISKARVDFKDNMFQPVFNKQIEDLDLTVYLSLPASVKFRGQAVISSLVSFSGQYRIPQKDLSAHVDLDNFDLAQFAVYMDALGIKLKNGILSSKADLQFKEGILSANLNFSAAKFNFIKDKLGFDASFSGDTSIKYGLADKQLSYAGKARIQDASITGIDHIGRLDNFSCNAQFDDKQAVLKGINASVSGVPFQAELKLDNSLQAPAFDLKLNSSFGMALLQDALNNKFKITAIYKMDGDAVLACQVSSVLPLSLDRLKVTGALDLKDVNIKQEKLPAAIEKVNGRINFTRDSLQWDNLRFGYMNKACQSSGSILSLSSPSGIISISSADLSAVAEFASSGKVLVLSKFKARYSNSEVSASGSFDLSQAVALAGVRATASVDLKDIINVVPLALKPQLEKASLNGKAEVLFELNGYLNALPKASLKMDIKTSPVSLYGIKLDGLQAVYAQNSGMGKFSDLVAFLYEGKITGTATVDLREASMPFSLRAVIDNVKLERLKMDTQAKDSDLSGLLSAQFELAGKGNDLQNIEGAGRVLVYNGKLWNLNLLKGIGKLLFTTDFTNVVFTQGGCDFIVGKQKISTDNLILISNLATIKGNALIGFDSSLDASLNVEISPDAPLTGGIRDITTAILGQATRFGLITIGGTLKEPKYKFKPAVGSIIKSFTDIFFKSQ